MEFNEKLLDQTFVTEPPFWTGHRQPLSGESFSSWFFAQGFSNGYSPQRFMQKLGLFRTDWDQVDLTEKKMDPILKVIAGGRDRALEMTLTGYGIQKSLWNYLPLREGAFCRSCLLEDPVPYFRRSWRFSFYTFCPIHLVNLSATCSKCQSTFVGPNSRFNSTLIRSHEWTNGCNLIACCGKCGTQLSDGPTTDVGIRNQVIDALSSIFAILNGSEEPTILGRPAKRQDFLNILIELSTIIDPKLLPLEKDFPSIGEELGETVERTRFVGAYIALTKEENFDLIKKTFFQRSIENRRFEKLVESMDFMKSGIECPATSQNVSSRDANPKIKLLESFSPQIMEDCENESIMWETTAKTSAIRNERSSEQYDHRANYVSSVTNQGLGKNSRYLRLCVPRGILKKLNVNLYDNVVFMVDSNEDSEPIIRLKKLKLDPAVSAKSSSSKNVN